MCAEDPEPEYCMLCDDVNAAIVIFPLGTSRFIHVTIMLTSLKRLLLCNRITMIQVDR